jgi:hypothetical protein
MKIIAKVFVALLTTQSILAFAQADGSSKAPAVSKVLEGYSNAEYQAMFKNYSYQTALIGGDASLFANTRMGLFFYTAVVP